MTKAFERLYAGCKRASEELKKERPHLSIEDKATLAELARQASWDGVVVRALSEWEADIGQCPLCLAIFPWDWFRDTKNQYGDLISACESCSEAGRPEPGLSKAERGL